MAQIFVAFSEKLNFNPHWHELWKQEKCSFLAPPRGIFYKTQWAWQGVKLTRLMSIFTSKIFDKNLPDKIWSKKDKEIKVSPLMSIRVNKEPAELGTNTYISIISVHKIQNVNNCNFLIEIMIFGQKFELLICDRAKRKLHHKWRYLLMIIFQFKEVFLARFGDVA